MIFNILLLLLAGCTSIHGAIEIDDLKNELISLRSASKTGVIRVTSEKAFKRFTHGKERPYSLYVFLNAKQVAENPQLRIGELLNEFSLAAKAVRYGPAPTQAFFLEIYYDDVPAVFHAIEANQVPYIFHIEGTQRISLSPGGFTVQDKDKMTFPTVGHKNYPWAAEEMLAYFAGRGLKHGPVNRPSLIKSPLFPLIVVGGASILGAAFYGLWQIGAVHHPLPYAVGSVAVYWFSVSGGMYNLIRGVPVFIRGKDGKYQFFLSSRNSQLGAEGFFMGTGYIVFSSIVSLLTYAVPRVKNTALRQILSYILAGGMAYLAIQLFLAYQAKSGYQISSYLFGQ